MVKHCKRYNAAIDAIEEGKNYSSTEAVSLAKKCATAKFDETVELHMKTGADPRHADQMVRGVALLPQGVGKQLRTIVFCQGDAIESAKEAGADRVGNDDLIKEIQNGLISENKCFDMSSGRVSIASSTT